MIYYGLMNEYGFTDYFEIEVLQKPLSQEKWCIRILENSLKVEPHYGQGEIEECRTSKSTLLLARNDFAKDNFGCLPQEIKMRRRTVDKASDWNRTQPWLVACDFISSAAINAP